MGWRKPAPPVMLALGALLGGLNVAGVYAGIESDPLALHWIRLALAPVGVYMTVAEEIMMRGYVMTQLERAGAATWLQVLLSGGGSAAYHSLHNPTWIGFLPSLVLFSLHALLYVVSRRSLAPSTLAHSMYPVLCTPYLLMFAMAQSAA